MTDRISQAAFLASLFRIEPTQGFVEYIEATKPYHTKILEVVSEYVFAENVNVTITEDPTWDIGLSRPDIGTVYSCGYGFVWDPLLTPLTPDNPLAPIIIQEATEAIPAPVAGFENSNTFLIQPATYTPFVVAVASIINNQLIFSKNYDVVGKDIGLNEWKVSDVANTLVTELTTGLLPKTIYISSDTGPVGNGQYTVTGVPTWAAGVTSVPVVETIPTQANADGVFHRVLELGELPQWPAGQAVTLTATTGTLPSPIVGGTRYYFQPTATYGYFNLTYGRYANSPSDYVDLTTIGSGEFTIIRDESLIPGATVVVTNTYLHRNDGNYTVKDIVPEGPFERVSIYQTVDTSTPFAFLGGDGQMMLDIEGFDEPVYCPPSQMSDLHADAFIHESLKFTFEINLSDTLNTTYSENAARGYGETFYGDALLGSYGTYADSFDSRTAQTSGSPGPDSAHTILPTGIDTQLFDVGGFDETLQTVKHFYGRSIP